MKWDRSTPLEYHYCNGDLHLEAVLDLDFKGTFERPFFELQFTYKLSFLWNKWFVDVGYEPKNEKH